MRHRETYVTRAVMAEKKDLDDELELKRKREVMARKFDAKMLARSYTKEAIATLVEVMQNKSATNADRVTAAKLLLERGHGRAPLTLEDGDGIKLPIVFLPVELTEDRKTITIDPEPKALPPIKRQSMDSRRAEEHVLNEDEYD